MGGTRKANSYVIFLLVLCVCWGCGQTGGGALERVNIFKNCVFWHLSDRESSLVQTFCESCVHLPIYLSTWLRTLWSKVVLPKCHELSVPSILPPPSSSVDEDHKWINTYMIVPAVSRSFGTLVNEIHTLHRQDNTFNQTIRASQT